MSTEQWKHCWTHWTNAEMGPQWIWCHAACRGRCVTSQKIQFFLPPPQTSFQCHLKSRHLDTKDFSPFVLVVQWILALLQTPCWALPRWVQQNCFAKLTMPFVLMHTAIHQRNRIFCLLVPSLHELSLDPSWQARETLWSDGSALPFFGSVMDQSVQMRWTFLSFLHTPVCFCQQILHFLVPKTRKSAVSGILNLRTNSVGFFQSLFYDMQNGAHFWCVGHQGVTTDLHSLAPNPHESTLWVTLNSRAHSVSFLQHFWKDHAMHCAFSVFGHQGVTTDLHSLVPDPHKSTVWGTLDLRENSFSTFQHFQNYHAM